MKKYDIVIIGGGPAGLAAAASARECGVDSILIIERDKELGGILNQCIHNGFGLHTFREELTGPEYACRFIEKVNSLKIEYLLSTMVMDISPQKVVTVMNRNEGLYTIEAKVIILAMGCRERPRGALNIPGFRPAGIFSAGTAQRLVNMEGYMPGHEVVILGSGDIGLIMARRMTLEGAKVKLVAELMPYSGGLKRNIVQCLDDFDIPLKLSHTVIDIDGRERLTGITLAKVDDSGKPIPGTEEYITCDTLLLSVGLIPENELSQGMGVEIDKITSGPVVNESLETNIEGVYACGNVLHVHDLVDYVSEEAALAGANAARYIKVKADEEKDSNVIDNRVTDDRVINKAVIDQQKVEIIVTEGVRYTVPKYINLDRMADTLTLRFRVNAVYKNSYISVYYNNERVLHKKKLVMAPGEMEEVKLIKDKLVAFNNLNNITVKIEKE